MRGLGSLRVGHGHVFHGAPDGLVAEALLHPGWVHVASHQVGRQRMLEGVRMPFLRRKAGGFRTVPKDAEELRAVKPSALMRREIGLPLIMARDVVIDALDPGARP